MGIIKRQGLKSSLVNYAGVLLGVVFFNFIFPHLISKEHLGLIGLMQYLMYVLAMFPALGLGHTLLRYYTIWQDTDILPRFNGLAMRLFMAGMLVFTLGYVIFKTPISSFYQSQSALFIPYYYLIIPLVFFYLLTQYFEYYSMLRLRVTVPTFLREIVVRVLLILLVYLFYAQFLNEKQFVWGFVLIYGITFLALYIYVNRVLHFQIKSPFPWPAHLAPLRTPMLYSAEMLLLTLCTNLHNFIDGLILPAYLGLGALAIYRIPLVLGQMIQVPYRAISLISIPILREALAQNDLKKVADLNRSLALNLFLIGTFLFTLLLINVDPMFRLLPPEYAAGKWVLYIIATGRLLDMSFGLNSEIIMNSNHYRFLTYFTVAMMLLTVGLNIFLIPHYGMNGAALSVSISLVVFNLMKTWFIRQRYKMWCFSGKYISLIGITGFILLLFHWFPYLTLINHHMFMNALANIALRGLLGSVLFVIPLYFMKVSPDFNSFLQLVLSGKILKGGHKMNEL